MTKETFETFDKFRDRHLKPIDKEVIKVSSEDIMSQVQKIRKGKVVR